MIFYSILYSLNGNVDYAFCFLMMLKSLVVAGTLKEGDRYYLIADDASWGLVAKCLRPEYRVIRLKCNTPKDNFEGMMLKYLLPTQLVSEADTVVYLDVDMLNVRPFRPELPPDSLAAYPEGSPEDTNYKGFDTPIRKGYSAGFFAWRPGPNTKGFFTEILDRMRSDRREFYTLDQPYFNAALASRSHPEFPFWLLSFNGHTNREQCCFLNMCGEPGDAKFHLHKMLQMFLQLF